MTVTLGDDLIYEVTIDDHDLCLQEDKYFHCSEFEHPKWCEHLANMVADNLDAGLWPKIWRELGDVNFYVPIIPTLAVFQEVNLRAVTLGKVPNPNAAEVMILDPSLLLDPSLRPGALEIGYMNIGDSINSLRTMILAWFESSVMHYTALQCQSASHKYTAQKNWQDSKKNPNRWLGQNFTVWKTRSCMVCRQGAMAEVDDDDLVPNPGRSRSPWDR